MERGRVKFNDFYVLALEMIQLSVIYYIVYIISLYSVSDKI